MKSWLVVMMFIMLSVMAGCGGSGDSGPEPEPPGGTWDLGPRPPVTGNNPAIRITEVRWVDSFDGGIEQMYASGKAYNVLFEDYTVCLFIRVPGMGWWPKPTYAACFTYIDSKGNFANHLMSGADDYRLDAVCALLVRKNTYRPYSSLPEPPEVDPSIGIVASDTVWKPE